MAKTLAFTQAAIGKLPCPVEGREVYRDTKTTGLQLVVSATGVKTFQVVRRFGGRATRLTIGHYPDLTAEQARKVAHAVAGEIAKGRNPAQERRKARGETTIGELFSLYLEGHSKPHKRSWQGDQDQYDRYLTAWKHRKLSEVRKADVATLHAKVGRDHGPYSANRLLALLSSMFNYAAGLGFERPNPAKGVKRFKEQSRDRFLRADELKSFFAALEHEDTPPHWRDFFMLCLLTGARRSNVQALRWSDLELHRGLWRIPEGQSKNKEPLICVLPPSAVEILKRRQAVNAAEPASRQSPYVFPATSKTGHVMEPKKVWAELLTRAKLSDLRLHDLRRTLGSWQAAMGASLPIIGRSLGHKNVATTQVYARLDLDPVKQSVHQAAEAILAAGGQAAKELPLLIEGEGAGRGES